MKRLSVVIASLILALVAAPVFAGAPFGWFDGSRGGGNAGGGQIAMTGWALDDDGILAVRIYVDGVIAGQASYGGSRPGVAALYPGFPDSNAAGWGFQLNTTFYLNGSHSVTFKATSMTGEESQIGRRVFQFSNTTHNLKPFGSILAPLENTELFGICDLNDPDRRYTVVNGWALDAGVEEGDLGVGYVELLIDGAIYANSRTSCFWGTETGGLTNCYGIRRLEVQEQYPTLRDAPHAGFRFVLDIGYLINFGYVPGHHVLTIRSGDVAGQVANIDEIPVSFFCDDYIPNAGSFGWFDRPEPQGVQGGGIITLTGWALDWEGIASVRLWGNGGVDLGLATTGIFRPLVNNAYPGYPDSLGAGWSLDIDPSVLPEGSNLLQVIVTDMEGVETMIGERPIHIAHP